MSGWMRNVWLTLPWLYHLMRGKIVRYEAMSTSPIPFRSVDGGRAPHRLDTPTAQAAAVTVAAVAAR
jgi:hypothetical protein